MRVQKALWNGGGAAAVAVEMVWPVGRTVQGEGNPGESGGICRR